MPAPPSPPPTPAPAPEAGSAPGLNSAVATAAEAARQRALAELMARICSRPEFPSLSQSVGEIQRIVRSELSHRRALTEGVLKDVGLTARLLRLINAACYRSVGAGTITSIERALSLVGYQAVGMMTVSLILFERLPQGVDGARVRADFSHALLAGLLAQELCHSGRHLENSYLTALYMNLGQMLLSLHFPEAAQALDEALGSPAGAGSHTLAGPGAHAERLRVSAGLLGLSVEDLGSEIAAQWGWPESLRGQLRRLYPSRPDRPVPDDDYLRVLATGATDLSAMLHRLGPGESSEEQAAARTTCVERFAESMGPALSVGGTSLQESVERALGQWQTLAGMLGVESALPQRRPRLRVVGQTPPRAPSPPAPGPALAGATAAPAPAPASSLTPGIGDSPVQPSEAAEAAVTAESGKPAEPAEPPEPAEASDGGTALTSALARASALALSETALQELSNTVLEDLRRALRLRQTALCLRTINGTLRARFAAGPVSAAVVQHFVVNPGSRQDLFALLCEHSRDTFISDASQPTVSAHLPGWFKEHVAAGTFVLLPMVAGRRVVGLLYADAVEPGSLHLDEQLLGQMGTLRNQLLLAMRLRGKA